MSQAHVGPDRGSTTGMPRWVKVIGITVVVVALVVISLMLSGAGAKHAKPHIPSGAPTPPSLVAGIPVVLAVLVVAAAVGVLVSRLITMTPRLRKFALTAHVTSSVGWLGAAAVLLAFGVAEWTSQDAQMVRAAILGMAVTAWFVAVPFSLASLLTGLVSSLGTPWGLFRYYWVVLKLLINVSTAIIWLLYAMELSYFADVVSTLPNADLGQWRNPSPMLHGGGALLMLLVATVLGVYKPRGMTQYGRRKQHEQGEFEFPAAHLSEGNSYH
ncbi:MAG: hypothetical protein ACE5JU_21365 [Candidatus Binatia bacterium]